MQQSAESHTEYILENCYLNWFTLTVFIRLFICPTVTSSSLAKFAVPARKLTACFEATNVVNDNNLWFFFIPSDL